MDFNEFLIWHGIVLRIVDLPPSINGVTRCKGVHYIILLNSKCSDIQQKETLKHELSHIFNNHFSYPNGCEAICEDEIKNMISKTSLTLIL